jgi:UDP-N-acetylmuramyl pentapeptide synthase
MFNTLFARFLAALARAMLAKYQPRIVGVTGSVGKTSTVAAIALALQGSFRVRAPKKNYNNEIGLPLAVFGEASPGRSVLGWLAVFLRVSWQLVIRNRHYPEVLVLEYGADHRGDIAYLTGVARPDIAVVTAVGSAHAEFLGTRADIWQEKSMLVRAVPPSGRVVLAADDAEVLRMREVAQAPVLTYGLLPSVDVSGVMGAVRSEHGMFGQVVSVRAHGLEGEVFLEQAIGIGHGRSVVAACAVGVALQVPLQVCLERLRAYRPIPGRMRVLPGRHDTWLLDDTYNASPEAVHAALNTLASIPLPFGARRMAMLGDMRELGRYAAEAHRAVGAHGARVGLDWLMAVGGESRAMADAAVAAGMPSDRVMRWAHAEEAAHFLEERLSPGDLVLIKGSQGMRMERATAALLRPTGDDEEEHDLSALLCRQGPEWSA